jgi:hypothetical protein
MSHLRLVESTPATPSIALAHTNRMGDTFYLHRGTTKTGKPRYFFAKKVGEGALGEMPAGFEVSESINGVVSVRRARPVSSPIPESDLKLVDACVRRQAHLQGYATRAEDGAIVVYEPHPRPTDLREMAARGFGMWEVRLDAYVADRMRRCQYAPVLKFDRDGDGYVVRRMTYRGEGGWSWELGRGSLAVLAKRFVPPIGTDEFFELL